MRNRDRRLAKSAHPRGHCADAFAVLRFLSFPPALPMSTTTQPPKPKRRWCRFSLRTLLVVMLVSCFGFAWIGSRMKRAQENRDRVAAVEEAVAAIEKVASVVEWEYKERRAQTWLEEQFDDPGSPDDPVGVLAVSSVDFGNLNITNADLQHLRRLNAQSVNLFGSKITDAGLEYLKGMTKLKYLDLNSTQVTDAGLEHLKGLTKLEHLDLGGTRVTGAGLKHLKGLTELQHLYLTSTKVTDAGLEHLNGLAKLKFLDLNGTQVTDAGLEHLKGLTKLECLYLSSTNISDAGLEHLTGLTNLQSLGLEVTDITDAGLVHLKGLTQLEELYLVITKVTDEGVVKLLEALPNCTIDH